MAGKREKPEDEDIVLKLRQLEVLQGQGRSTAEAVRQFIAIIDGVKSMAV